MTLDTVARTRSRHVVTALASAALLTGLVACGSTDGTDDAAASTAHPAATTQDAVASPSAPAAGIPIPGPGGVARAVPAGLRPVRIAVPSIGVDASLTRLGISGDGAIEVPGNPVQAGWLDTSPAPGQQGPSVIAGHVDSTTGPAVFYRLSDLKVGAAIEVTRANGSTVRFTVDGVKAYAKNAFPTRETYGPVPGAAVRLITCGGEYVKSRGGYLDNVVVFAS
jgi:hypothetical protein